VPGLQLSGLNGGTRLQSSRRHPDRARRRCRRNDRLHQAQTAPKKSV